MATAVSVGATNNAEIDGLLGGTRWSGSITYSFPDSPSDYPSSGYSADNEPAASGFASAPAAMQSAINYAIGLIQGYTNISISYAGTNTADLQIAQSSAANPTSWAYLPWNAAAGGDIWFGTAYNYSQAKLGNYYFATALHELGHALGLKHSQEAGGVANVAVPYAHDNSEYSIMSYRSYAGAPLAGYTAESYGFSQGYMANDILALQTLYGANYGTQGGNTVYTWSTTTGQMFINGVGQPAPGGGAGGSANRVFETIWDGNGIDTYDLSNYATSVSIDLNPGASSITSAAQLAYLGDGHYAAGNVYNSYLFNGDTRSLIENAIGGSAADTLVGNAIANNLNGGGGNDTFTGGAGNDTITGGSGTDKAVYGGNRANYLVTYNSSTQTFTVADQRGSSPDGTDTVTGVENFQFADGVYASSSLISVVNSAPMVTIPQANVTASSGQSIAASSLFTVTDANNDVLTYYLYDANAAANSGHWVVNGTVISAQTVVALSALQLAQTYFVAGAAGTTDAIAVMAYDGAAYSGNTSFSYLNVNVPAPVNHAPAISVPTANVAASAGQVFSASSLFSGTDADNDILTYYLYDSSSAPNSGHWVVNGADVSPRTVVALSPSQIAQATFVAGSAGTTDTLAVMVYDGHTYSANTSFTYFSVNVAAPVSGNQPPAVVIPNATVTAGAGQTLAASNLFSATDIEKDILTYYLYDSSSDPSSGHWVVNGSAVAPRTVVALSPSQMAQATFVAGSAGTTDTLAVMVYDGHNYSGNTSFTYFSVSVPASSSAPLAANGLEAHSTPDPFPLWTPDTSVQGVFGTGHTAFAFAPDGDGRSGSIGSSMSEMRDAMFIVSQQGHLPAGVGPNLAFDGMVDLHHAFDPLHQAIKDSFLL